MAQLLVRDLEPEVVVALRAQAAKHRRSVEAEHRAILRQVLLPAKSLMQHLREMPPGLDDADFEHREEASEAAKARADALLADLSE